MPLYEYLCRDCGQTSEHLVMGRDEALTCPECGSSNLAKLLSASANHSAFGDRMPGSGDTSCCGHSPGQAPGCAGPGSCCGKA